LLAGQTDVTPVLFCKTEHVHSLSSLLKLQVGAHDDPHELDELSVAGPASIP
jgi:hypothetical protein